jgi:hypothetical protein
MQWMERYPDVNVVLTPGFPLCKAAGTYAVTDEQTGLTWDLEHGLALSGPLKGAALQRLSWTDVYLDSALWE